MVIGSILLQPQRLQRASTRDASAVLMDDLVHLAWCLAKDATSGASAMRQIEQAVETTMQAVLDAKSAGIQAAVQRFAGLFETVRQQLEAFLGESIADANDLMHFIAELLESVFSATEGLTPDLLRQQVNGVFAVIADDLGLTPAFLEETVWALFDGAILALQQGLDDESPVQRANRRDMARLLRRLKRHLRGLFTFPQFNADLVVDALLTLLKNLGVEPAQVACIGQGLATSFRAADSLLDLINYSAFSTFGDGSVGAAAAPPAREQYCWYATWLLEYQNDNATLGVLPASMTEELFDGYVSTPLRDALRPLSVVLARSANVQTVTAKASWKIIDRKKYIINRVNSQLLAVYRLFEMSEGDFVEAIADTTRLQKIFRDNGLLLSIAPSVAHEDGSNLWTIVAGALTYRAFQESGTITIHPQTIAGALFDVSATFIPALDQRQVSDALVLAFENGGVPLTPKASLSVRRPGSEWLIDDGELEYAIKKAGDQLEVNMGGAGGWIKAQLGWPEGDKVWIDRQATRVMLGQRILHLGTAVTWQDAPLFTNGSTRYTFKLASPALMEHFALHSAWAQDALNTLLHLSSIERGDIASNIVNASWNIYEMIMKLALRRPSSDVIGYWPNWSLPLLATVIASLEGMHTKVSPYNWFAFWFFILLSTDLGEKALYSYWLSLLRGLFLSSVTLLNQDTSTPATRPRNFCHIEPWISGFVDLSLFVLAKAIPRDKYTYPFENAEMTAGYWVGGGLGVGLLGGLLGATAAAGLARGTFDGGNYLKASLKGLLWGLLRFWPMVFLVKEGDTADGTHNPNGANFPGYPAGGASSPYNMPYPAETSVLWGQGNQGMFSHHDYDDRLPQVYAFDVAMDQDDPVLAMRPGTVVDYFDWIPNDVAPDDQQQADATAAAMASGAIVPGQTTSTRRNFIAIRHDRDEEGNLLANPVNTAYDLDAGGAPTVTYAFYLHGRQDSVRTVFATRGIAANSIIGQSIRRGQRIMLAGDTGRSLHNHLHIQVRPGPLPGQFLTDPGSAPKMDVANRTIPFTFREVDDVPKMLNTYTSQNTET